MRLARLLLLPITAALAASVAAAPIAVAEPGSYRLWAGESLQPGQRLVSPGGQFVLSMNEDGELVETDAAGTEHWSSDTSVPGSVLEMQPDGNAVVYAPGHVAVWESSSVGTGAQTIEVQDDGNIVLYAEGHVAGRETGAVTDTPTGPGPASLPNSSTSAGGGTSGAGGPPSPEGHTSYIECTIWGADGPDDLTGTTGDDVICGQGGNDRITGGGGFDKIYGGPGDDTLTGNDTVQTLDGAALVESGQPIGDEIQGDEGDDIVSAGAGKDSVEAGPGRDQVEGGDGDDRIAGDRFTATAGDPDGDDDIRTGAGNDDVHAGGGNDVVIDAANTVADIVEGDAGNDAIIGLAGFSAQYDGGSGNDLLFPAPGRLSPLGNSVRGGEGNDVAILMNGQIDGFTRGAYMETINIPVQKCQITYPIAPDNYDKTSEFKFGCPILGPVDLQIAGDGTPSVGSDLYSRETSLNPADWRNLVLDKAGQLRGDACVCDQILGVPVLQQDQVY